MFVTRTADFRMPPAETVQQAHKEHQYEPQNIRAM